MVGKRILFIATAPPFSGTRALETLDAALVGGAFEQQVSVLFIDEGVWQLHRDQHGAAVNARTVSDTATSLPLHGVDAIYVDLASVRERRLVLNDFVLPVRMVDHAAQQQLLSSQDVVFSS